METDAVPVPGHGEPRFHARDAAPDRASFRAWMASGQPVQLPPQTRTVMVDRAALDADARTMEISFSSEAPVERWWGTEVLGHGRGEVDLGFMGSGRAPLLYQHDPDRLIGVVE